MATSQKLAREIMGNNFFGIEEATRYFKITPTEQQLTALAEIPWSTETLEQCKKTHVLAAVFPISILGIRERVERELFVRSDLGTWEFFQGGTWYEEDQMFAKEQGRVSWQLVRKTPVEDSASRGWKEQQALLAKNEETPRARIMVYTIIGHFLSTGERLFEEVGVCCLDVVEIGFRVYVGHFASVGLTVARFIESERGDSGRWLASVRKPE